MNKVNSSLGGTLHPADPSSIPSQSPPPSTQPLSTGWCTIGRGVCQGDTLGREGSAHGERRVGTQMDREGASSKGHPASCLVKNGIRICRRGRTAWGQKAAREVASIPTVGLPRALFLPQLGQSCAPAQQPGSARARELLPSESWRGRQPARQSVRGQGAAQEARGMLLSALPEMLRGCSGVPGGCCPRCSEDAACPVCSGRCWPGWQRNAREVLGRCGWGWCLWCSGPCSRVARGMLGKCSPG